MIDIPPLKDIGLKNAAILLLLTLEGPMTFEQIKDKLPEKGLQMAVGSLVTSEHIILTESGKYALASGDHQEGLEQSFEEARILYKKLFGSGKVRGFRTEWAQMKKTCRSKGELVQVVPKLVGIIQAQHSHRSLLAAKNKFVAEPKHFQFWISGRRWELELEESESQVSEMYKKYQAAAQAMGYENLITDDLLDQWAAQVGPFKGVSVHYSPATIKDFFWSCHRFQNPGEQLIKWKK